MAGVKNWGCARHLGDRMCNVDAAAEVPRPLRHAWETCSESSSSVASSIVGTFREGLVKTVREAVRATKIKNKAKEEQTCQGKVYPQSPEHRLDWELALEKLDIEEVLEARVWREARNAEVEARTIDTVVQCVDMELEDLSDEELVADRGVSSDRLWSPRSTMATVETIDVSLDDIDLEMH